MDSSSPRSPLDDGEIADEDSREFDDGYDENLMGDEEDRRKLAQMTEKEREQELFNRSERRETLKIRFEIERKLRAKSKKREVEQQQPGPSRPRKRLRASEIYSSDGSSDESDEYVPDAASGTHTELSTSGTRSSRVHTRASSTVINGTSSASASSSSSSSSSSDSEPEHDDLRDDDDSQIDQDDYQMSLADLKCIQLKREQIDDWVYSPFFKETAIGLFVKISIGNSARTGLHMYKIAQVMDITKGSKIYTITKHKTDKHCLVKIGNVERTYAMHFISNRSFDEDDYNKWRNDLHDGGLNLPSRDHFIRKKRDMQRALNYEYTDQDIDYEVNEKRKFQHSSFNFAMKKTQLIREKAEAEDLNDYDKAREIQQALDELEEQAKQLEKSRSSSTFSAISFVNERNRIKNIEESERVLKESKSVKTEDPFTRRKCTPTIVHNRNSNQNIALPGDTNGLNDKNGHQLHNKNDLNLTKTNGFLKTIPESVKSVNDLFQAHANIDLELDIDI